jgi:hypothetical protein
VGYHIGSRLLSLVVGFHRLITAVFDNLLLCLDLSELHLLALDFHLLLAQSCLKLNEVGLRLLYRSCIHLPLLLKFLSLANLLVNLAFHFLLQDQVHQLVLVALELDFLKLLMCVDLLVVVFLAAFISGIDGCHHLVIELITPFAAISCVLFCLIHLDFEAVTELLDLSTVFLSAHSHSRKLTPLQKRAIIGMNPLPVSHTFFSVSLSVF